MSQLLTILVHVHSWLLMLIHYCTEQPISYQGTAFQPVESMSVKFFRTIDDGQKIPKAVEYTVRTVRPSVWCISAQHNKHVIVKITGKHFLCLVPFVCRSCSISASCNPSRDHPAPIHTRKCYILSLLLPVIL